MPYQHPHFAVPDATDMGNELVDCQIAMTGPHVFGIYWILTNQYEQRCIKHLGNLPELRSLQAILEQALNNGTASRTAGHELRYTLENVVPPVRYEFCYDVAITPPMGAMAKCWAIHKYERGSLYTGSGSKSLHLTKMQERFSALKPTPATSSSSSSSSSGSSSSSSTPTEGKTAK